MKGGGSLEGWGPTKTRKNAIAKTHTKSSAQGLSGEAGIFVSRGGARDPFLETHPWIYIKRLRRMEPLTGAI